MEKHAPFLKLFFGSDFIVLKAVFLFCFLAYRAALLYGITAY